jgi:hypothetical protein
LLTGIEVIIVQRHLHEVTVEIANNLLRSTTYDFIVLVLELDVYEATMKSA